MRSALLATLSLCTLLLPIACDEEEGRGENGEWEARVTKYRREAEERERRQDQKLEESAGRLRGLETRVEADLANAVQVATRESERAEQLEEQASALEESLAHVTEQLEKARAELAALRKLVPDAPAPTAPRAIHATVTEVKEEVNVVLLSAGSDDGVEVGDEFTVYRGNEYVAKVVVDRVAADHCAAHSRKDIEKSPIRVGDPATTRF